MSISDDRWFEIWFSEGEDLRPSWLLIVTPDPKKPGSMIVYDPQENFRIVEQAESYEDTRMSLLEDEFHQVEGRMFPDDEWPLPFNKG